MKHVISEHTEFQEAHVSNVPLEKSDARVTHLSCVPRYRDTLIDSIMMHSVVVQDRE